jgi:protein-arginine deiminase
MDAELVAFLKAQRVQAPIPVETSWLVVGHVDEILSFVPFANPGNPYKRWKLLLASPRRAYQILRDANPALNMLVGRTFQGQNAEMTIDTFLTGATPVADNRAIPIAPAIQGPDLANFNTAMQVHIDAVRDALVSRIDLDINVDVIEVPVVVYPEDAAWTIAGFLTADMVNMLVVNGHCIIAQAFGPEGVTGADLFGHDLRGQLQAIGLRCHFIDDWTTYHLYSGEVHCGTNTLRRPADRNAWAATAAARWWEYDG